MKKLEAGKPVVKVRQHGPPNELKFSITFNWDEADPHGAHKAGAAIGKMLGAILEADQVALIVKELAPLTRKRRRRSTQGLAVASVAP